MSKRTSSLVALIIVYLAFSVVAFNIFKANANGLIGDLNGDGTVDIKDVREAAQAFGSYPGHSRWNSQADINGDEVVNMIDISIIASNFGKTNP